MHTSGAILAGSAVVAAGYPTSMVAAQLVPSDAADLAGVVSAAIWLAFFVPGWAVAVRPSPVPRDRLLPPSAP